MTNLMQCKVLSNGLSVAALIICLSGSALAAQRDVGLDSAAAVQMLSNARGANPVMCELAVHSINARYGNWGRTGRAPDAIIGQRSLLDRAGQDIEDIGTALALGNALTDDDVCVSRMAARLFGRVTHPDAWNILVRHLGSRDDGTRRMAAIALGYLESEDAVESLVDVLSDELASVRAAATWALGEIEDERALDALTGLLGDDPDPFVRRQAAWALGNMY